MKYFTAGEQPNEKQFTGIRALRQYLTEHPEVKTVTRWWWSGNDLIECIPVSREDILLKKAAELKAGQTAQWAYDHGRLAPAVTSRDETSAENRPEGSPQDPQVAPDEPRRPTGA